jgi:cysteine desulfurase
MIYLDHAAATPVSEKAKKAMEPYLSAEFFNPSAPYLSAVKTRRAYEDAKDRIAHVIGAKGADLIITSGATESISLAFNVLSKDAEVLISAVEHKAVTENAKRFNTKIIDVDKNGRVDVEDFKKKLNPRTSFVSICLASGELGTIQPISEIAAIVKQENLRRKLAGETTPLYFHCDASQGLGLLEVKVGRLGVDLLTINSAKVYGPKGAGALYVGHNVKLNPMTLGGGQEMGLRSGTENVPAVIGFATAIEEAEKHLNGERKRLEKLKTILKNTLSDIPNIILLGNTKNQLVNFLPISVPGVDAERLIFALEDKEVYLSTGAACSASKGIKSATLQAIGLNDDEIAGSLRITLGKLNDEENVKEAGKLIKAAILAEQARIDK